MKRLLASFLVVLVVGAAPAFGQTPRSERPYRGLFGGGVGDSEQSLTLNVQLAGGYDDNVSGDQSIEVGTPVSASDPRMARSDSYAQVSSALNYSLNRTRFSLGAFVGTSTRRYSEIVDDWLGSYNGGLAASLRLSRRATLTGSQSVGYQPSIVLHLMPELVDPEMGLQMPPTLDFDTTRQEHLSHSSTIDFRRGIGRRGSLGLGYARQFSDFDAAQQDLITQDGHAQYSHSVSKGLGLRIGYGYMEGRYPSGDEPRTTQGHTLDVGADFSRALSFSRRTTFSFATGSSAIVDGERIHYRLTADARLNHEIGRTWNASIAYTRGLGFIEAFREPFFSDSLNIGLGGLVTRRVQFRAGAGTSFGDVGLSGGNDFDTYVGSVSLNVALTRHLGLGTDYFYYRHHFDAQAVMPAGMSREIDRHGVRAYLAIWAPIFHRNRRPDAAR